MKRTRPQPELDRERALVVRQVELRLGLQLNSNMHRTIGDAIDRLIAERQVPSLTWLHANLDHLQNSPVLDALTEAASVGETRFFRYPVQMRALESEIRTQLLPAKRAEGSRTFRAWSAACSTGEEVYTLAVLLMNIASDFNVQVIGTDMNAASLAIAESGRYQQRYLQQRFPKAMEAALVKVGNEWVIRPEIKAVTRFTRLNLVSDHFPAVARGLFGFDVILCRNVLIYLNKANIPDLMGKFSLAAANRCIIGLTPTEFEAAKYLKGFQTRPSALLLRSRHSMLDGPKEPASAPIKVSRAPRQVTKPRVPPTAPARASPASPPQLETLLAAGRKAADRGNLDEALELSLKAATLSPNNADAFFMTALVLSARGDHRRALDEYRRVLFLDRTHAAAEIGFAQALSREGLVDDARRHFRLALNLLEPRGAHEEVKGLAVSVEVARRIAQDGLE